MIISSTWIRRLLCGMVVAVTVIAASVIIMSFRLSERSAEIAIDLIEERFDRDVELEDLRLQVFPWARATGRGLVIHQTSAQQLPPFVRIDSFVLDADLLTLLFFRPIQIDRLTLDGLEIHIPPDDENEDDPPDERPDSGEDAPLFLIHEVRAPGTKLYIHSTNPEHEPLLWDIQELTLHSAGTTDPMNFVATLTNAKPPGLIRSTGSFGPWQEDELGSTPVSGTYTFADADLSVFNGIRGTLSSQGEYGGVLGRLTVTGTTDTPEFGLDVSGNTIRLRTEFETVVDGTNGDTLLEPVRAWIGETAIVARGEIVHRNGVDGKTIALDVTVSDGRLADLLTLGMKSEEPFMTGTIGFETEFLLPQGEEDVIDKLQLNGSFGVSTATFSEATLQEKLDSLSGRSRGEHDDPERIASDFRGDFRLESAVLDFTGLSFQVPGALVELEGTYGLKTEEIDMRGTLHMEATLSEATTGFKSFLLKLVDPFFGGEGDYGSRLPIQIDGTRNDPDIGLRLGGN